MLLKERSPLSMLPPPLNLIPTSLILCHWFWCNRAIYEGKREIHKTAKQVKAIASNLKGGSLPPMNLSQRPKFSGETFTISYPGTLSDAVVQYVVYCSFFNYPQSALLSCWLAHLNSPTYRWILCQIGSWGIVEEYLHCTCWYYLGLWSHDISLLSHFNWFSPACNGIEAWSLWSSVAVRYWTRGNHTG